MIFQDWWQRAYCGSDTSSITRTKKEKKESDQDYEKKNGRKNYLYKIPCNQSRGFMTTYEFLVPSNAHTPESKYLNEYQNRSKLKFLVEGLTHPGIHFTRLDLFNFQIGNQEIIYCI